MPTARRNADRCGQPRNRRGTQAVGRRPVAELAAIVASPCPHSAVASQGQGVACAAGGGYGHYVRQARNLRGRKSVGGRAVAELTVGVAAPCPDGAVGHKCDGMEAAGGYGDHVRKAGDLGRIRPGRGCAVTELAGVVVAPCPDGSITPERHSELRPRRHRELVLTADDVDRHAHTRADPSGRDFSGASIVGGRRARADRQRRTRADQRPAAASRIPVHDLTRAHRRGQHR